MTPAMHFITEEEFVNKFNFLDNTISKYDYNTQFSIYRKSTANNNIIPNDSCEPYNTNWQQIDI
jgi:hypothetical protein